MSELNKAELEFNKAFIKAQQQIRAAKKDSDNPAFRSKYADLESVADACREALNSNGIAFLQKPIMPRVENCVSVETTLLHAEGHREIGVCDIPLAKRDAHGYGSALSYGRRYGLAAMAGVVTGDDDANAASDKSTTKGAPVTGQIASLKSNLKSAKAVKLSPSGTLEWPPELAGQSMESLNRAQLEWCIKKATQEAQSSPGVVWGERLLAFTDEYAERQAKAVKK
jgi:hypothetical protein